MTNENTIASLEALVKKMEKLASLGTLTAGITHEIQNPLNFVINFSKMSEKLVEEIQDIIHDNEDAINPDDRDDLFAALSDLQENMQKISSHGDRAISIVRNILLYSRGKQDAYIPTDIPKIVKEYVWLSYHSMRANNKGFNVTINETYANGMPLIEVVPQDLCRAILNIMNNACYTVLKRQKAADENYKPTIDVVVSQQNGNLLITIADNGEGMTEEVQQKIYEEFFTTKPEGEGTGLGMALTRDIIEQKHDGKLSFTSTEGEGTTFTIEIPIKKD